MTPESQGYKQLASAQLLLAKGMRLQNMGKTGFRDKKRVTKYPTYVKQSLYIKAD